MLRLKRFSSVKRTWLHSYDVHFCVLYISVNGAAYVLLSVVYNGIQRSIRWANRPPLWRPLATVNWDTCLFAIHSCCAMLTAVWFWSLFTCRMIYRSSLVVFFFDRLPPTFLTAMPFSEGFPGSWNDTFVSSKLLGNRLQTTYTHL